MVNDAAVITLCARLGEVLRAVPFSEAAVRDLIGDAAFGCLSRGEPGPVETAAAGATPLAVLTRLFLAAGAVSRAEADVALDPVTTAEAVEAGLLEPDPDDGSLVRSALGLRPLDLPDGSTQWFLSDLDGAMRPHTRASDHVLGVGHASQSLLRATPREPVDTVLDLGSGCGVHACAASGFANRVTATDISERAALFTTASAALNSVDMTVRAGSWFEPVENEQFDLLLANPPFVVGAEATSEHTYRDSGLDLDGASALVVSSAPKHLAPGGTAAMLASWVHLADQAWTDRIASWLPAEGVEAWVLQRDVADPQLYVGTWLRDEGLDARIGAGRAKSDLWLAHFAASGVTGVGFGYVFLRATEGPTSVVCEELSHPFDDPLGPEALEQLARMQWLREASEADVGAARPLLRDDVALERVATIGTDGWEEVVVRVTRMSGPRWSHEIDDATARLLAGCRGAVTTDDLALLLGAALGTHPGTDLNRESAAGGDAGLMAAVRRTLVELFRHGFITFC